EARVLFERAQLAAGVVQRLGPERRHRTVVRHRTERGADDRAQFLDLLARLVDVGPAVDRSGAVLDLLVELGNRLLERVELLGQSLARRVGSGLPRLLRHPHGRRHREHGGKQQRRRKVNETSDHGPYSAGRSPPPRSLKINTRLHYDESTARRAPQCTTWIA